MKTSFLPRPPKADKPPDHRYAPKPQTLIFIY